MHPHTGALLHCKPAPVLEVCGAAASRLGEEEEVMVEPPYGAPPAAGVVEAVEVSLAWAGLCLVGLGAGEEVVEEQEETGEERVGRGLPVHPAEAVSTRSRLQRFRLQS